MLMMLAVRSQEDRAMLARIGVKTLLRRLSEEIKGKLEEGMELLGVTTEMPLLLVEEEQRL